MRAILELAHERIEESKMTADTALALLVTFGTLIMRPAPMTPREAIRRAAGEYGVSEELMLCLCEAESNFDPKAVGALGERGLFQFMPDTWRWAREWMGENPDFELAFDPEGAARTAGWLIKRGYGHLWATWEGCG